MHPERERVPSLKYMGIALTDNKGYHIPYSDIAISQEEAFGEEDYIELAPDIPFTSSERRALYGLTERVIYDSTLLPASARKSFPESDSRTASLSSYNTYLDNEFREKLSDIGWNLKLYDANTYAAPPPQPDLGYVPVVSSETAIADVSKLFLTRPRILGAISAKPEIQDSLSDVYSLASKSKYPDDAARDLMTLDRDRTFGLLYLYSAIDRQAGANLVQTYGKGMEQLLRVLKTIKYKYGITPEDVAQIVATDAPFFIKELQLREKEILERKRNDRSEM